MLKSKFLFIFLSILVVLNIFTVYSSAFSVNYENEKIDFGDIDSKLMQFTLVYPRTISGKVDAICLYTFDVEPVVKTGDVSVVGNGSSWTYYFSNKTVGQSWNNVPVMSPHLVVVSDIPGGFLYSSFDLKDEDGNVVFQRPVPTLGGRYWRSRTQSRSSRLQCLV